MSAHSSSDSSSGSDSDSGSSNSSDSSGNSSSSSSSSSTSESSKSSCSGNVPGGLSSTIDQVAGPSSGRKSSNFIPPPTVYEDTSDEDENNQANEASENQAEETPEKVSELLESYKAMLMKMEPAPLKKKKSSGGKDMTDAKSKGRNEDRSPVKITTRQVQEAVDYAAAATDIEGTEPKRRRPSDALKLAPHEYRKIDDCCSQICVPQKRTKKRKIPTKIDENACKQPGPVNKKNLTPANSKIKTVLPKEVDTVVVKCKNTDDPAFKYYKPPVNSPKLYPKPIKMKDGRFFCPDCNFIGQYSAKVRKHQTDLNCGGHGVNFRYKCAFGCDTVFAVLHDLDKHYKSCRARKDFLENQDKSYKCCVCEKVYVVLAARDHHEQFAHNITRGKEIVPVSNSNQTLSDDENDSSNSN